MFNLASFKSIKNKMSLKIAAKYIHNTYLFQKDPAIISFFMTE